MTEIESLRVHSRLVLVLLLVNHVGDEQVFAKQSPVRVEAHTA